MNHKLSTNYIDLQQKMHSYGTPVAGVDLCLNSGVNLRLLMIVKWDVGAILDLRQDFGLWTDLLHVDSSTHLMI